MRGFYGELGDTDRSFDTLKILGEYFGFSYPELEGKRDMKKLDILYRDLLYQQTASDPVILTPDLANPYNSSLHQEAVLNPSFSAP